MVEGLGSYSSPDVKEIDKPRQSIDYLIEARHAEGLSEMGFIPLIQNLTWIEPSFFSDQSCSKPKQYDSEAANKYARSTTKLPYIFAISRFAHYLKVIVRDRSQPFTDGQECQNYLNRWVQQYVPNTFEDRNSFRCPLRECRIEIAEEALAEDEFKAVVFLLPTYQFEVEDLRIALRMVVDLPTNQRNSTVTTYDLKEITAKSEPTTKPGIAQIDELFKLQIKEMSEEVLCDLGEIGGLYSIDGRVTLRRLKQKSPRNFVCSLDDEFLDHHHEFYLALLSPEPAERVQRTTKLSSPETIQTVVERALPGVTLKHIFTGIFQYFLLETEDNAYWNLIKQAKNMAVNVWPELIFAEPILLGVPKVLPKKTRSLFENQILNFLNEPSLDVEDAGNNVHSYRFFWKPGPVDNRLFRVNIEADQTGSIVVKDYRISIQAGQLEIHWIKNETFPLTSEEIVWWLKLLERCRFWEIEDEPPRQGRMEGACWTIEGLKYGHQHEFFRLTPREPDIRELGLAFLRLARFKIDENYFF